MESQWRQRHIHAGEKVGLHFICSGDCPSRSGTCVEVCRRKEVPFASSLCLFMFSSLIPLFFVSQHSLSILRLPRKTYLANWDTSLGLGKRPKELQREVNKVVRLTHTLFDGR